MSAYLKLHKAQQHIRGLWDAAETLRWDRDAIMPAEVSHSRSMQLEALEVAHHAAATDPRLSDLIADAAEDSLLKPLQRRNVQLCRRAYEEKTQLSTELVARKSRATSASLKAWEVAKEENDWRAWLPAFAEIVDITREIAQVQASDTLTPYDTCLDRFQADNRLSEIQPLFTELNAFLTEFVPVAIERQNSAGTARTLVTAIPEDRQHELCLQVARQLGFNFNRGRLDKSAHPFSSEMTGDARITTRYDAQDFTSSLTSTVHETGHALYSQNGMATDPDWYGQPVAAELGMMIHESQSLFYEKQLGMSDSFIGWLAPLAAKVFGLHGEAIVPAQLARHLRTVTPSFIRTEADEVTYPLHIMLRTELESDLINGKLEPRHVRDAWNASFERKLGLSVPDDRRGCLQDVHWPEGLFGYFPCYTQGAIVAAALMERVRDDIPDLDDQTARGEFRPILNWLTENIHSQGSRYSGPELVERVTGQPLRLQPFKAHLQRRYLG